MHNSTQQRTNEKLFRTQPYLDLQRIPHRRYHHRCWEPTTIPIYNTSATTKLLSAMETTGKQVPLKAKNEAQYPIFSLPLHR
jgi:hypothetical protein